jgi:predicted Zn-dependent peptidase
VNLISRPIEQANLVLGCEGLSRTDDRRFALGVLNAALGGGMSSRLFQEARERRGLCYSIYSFHMPYSDIGMFGLYAGTDAADTSELMRLIVDEIVGTAETLSEPEVARAKAQMKAGLLMALESSGARIEQLARQMITRGRPVPLDELVAKVDAVTVESARAAGRALISRGKLATAVLGLGSGLESAAAIAETLTRRAA